MRMTQSPTLTIFAGISGIDKEHFLSSLLKKSRMGKKTLLINFEDELIVDRGKISIADMPTFLNSPNPALKFEVFRTNFSEIAKKIRDRKSPTTNIFLSMHLSYYKNSEFYPPFMPIFFKEILTLLPDSKIRIITLIDDIFVTWKKISDREKSAGYANTKLTLREILAWRSLEFLRGEALKEHINTVDYGRRASHYMVSIRHPHPTFHNMIFRDSPTRIYLSYHISESRKTLQGKKEINQFRLQMHEFGHKEKVPIFDPVTIDELAMVFALKESRSKNTDIQKLRFRERDRWPIELTDLDAKEAAWPIELPAHEIDQVGADISNQIRSRDYTLVDTATHLAVYRPFFNGKTSQGVEAEIKRANDNFSSTIVYHPSEDQKDEGASPRPFGNICTMFDDKKEFIEHLQKLVRIHKRRVK